MSARDDRHYKPRRFREETDDAAVNKLKTSRSAKKYMVKRDEENIAEPVAEKESPPAVKVPSRVRVPADEPVRTVRKQAAPKKEEKPEPIKTAETVERPEPAAKAEPAEKPAPEAEKAAATEAPEVKPEPVSEDKPAEAETAEATEPPKEPEDAVANDENESFDYVVPAETYKEHHSHKHKSSHTHSGQTEQSSSETEDDDYVFEDDNPDNYTQLQQKGKKKKRSKVKTVLIAVLCVLLAFVIGSVSAFFVLREIGRSRMHNYDKIEIEAPSEDESGKFIDTLDATGRVINYDGVSYEFNDNVMSVVFIGADYGVGDDEELQMGDAIYILTVDSKSGDIKILGVSRDTMSDVDVYSRVDGTFIDTEKLQLTYAYSYGNSRVSGGQNTLTSVSRLFYGLPLQNFFAIDMNALTTLNDAIGGVTLTSSMTFVSPVDGRTINEGETVTLHGAEAESYVRSRDIDQLDSNNDRMQRQQEYIRGFISSIFPAAKKDISIVSDLYNAITENSDSTLDITKTTYLASTALSHMNSASDVQYLNLQGKVVEGDYAEVYVSNEDTIRTMLDVFYKPIEFEAIKETQ